MEPLLPVVADISGIPLISNFNYFLSQDTCWFHNQTPYYFVDVFFQGTIEHGGTISKCCCYIVQLSSHRIPTRGQQITIIRTKLGFLNVV